MLTASAQAADFVLSCCRKADGATSTLWSEVQQKVSQLAPKRLAPQFETSISSVSNVLAGGAGAHSNAVGRDTAAAAAEAAADELLVSDVLHT